MYIIYTVSAVDLGFSLTKRQRFKFIHNFYLTFYAKFIRYLLKVYG